LAVSILLGIKKTLKIADSAAIEGRKRNWILSAIE